jgi:serine/threonine protein kinase
MRTEQWEKVKDVVAAAMNVAPEQRTDLVERLAAGDETVLREAKSLLSCDMSHEIIADRYRIERELGRGGFAVTYLASDLQLFGRNVAIKILNTLQPDPWVAARFDEELKALARIQHPGVVQPLGAGALPDGKRYIVMEFVRGCTLREAMQSGRLPLHRIAEIMRSLGSALALVHASGIFHGDLKPENIMLEDLGDGNVEPRLIDFGIARFLERHTRNATVHVAGTLVYMAPEQVEGQLMHATDVFALGATCYELLTGHVPFPAKSLAELIEKHRVAPEPPSQLRLELSGKLETLVLQALARDPLKRPQDIGPFTRDLAVCLQLAETSVVGSGPNTGKNNSRRFYGLVLSVFVVLLIALVVGGNVYRAHRSAAVGSNKPSLPTNIPESKNTAPDTVTTPRSGKSPGGLVQGPPAVWSDREKSAPSKSSAVPAAQPGTGNPIPSTLETDPRTPPAPNVEKPISLPAQWAMINGSPAQNGATNGVGPVSPRELWRFTVPTTVRGSVVVGGDGTVYFGDQGGTLYAVRNGKKIWEKPQKGPILSTPLLVEEGLIVATLEPAVVLIRPDGSPGWTLPIAMAPGASPIAENGTVFLGSTDGNVYAIRNEQVVWKQSLGRPVKHTVSVDRDIVLVAAGSVVHALGASDGSKRWARDVDDEIAATPTTNGQASIYVTSATGVLRSYSRTGNYQWPYQAAAPILTSASLSPKGSVLFGCADRNLYAVRDTDQLWKFSTSGAVRTSPIIDRNGVSYVGSANGTLYAVGSTGTLEWTVEIGGELTAPLSLGTDGTIFAVTQNRVVMALR